MEAMMRCKLRGYKRIEEAPGAGEIVEFSSAGENENSDLRVAQNSQLLRLLQ